MTDKSRYDIFLSHASKNDEFVTRLHDTLEAATGLNIWVDHKDIEPGQEWQVEIDTALQLCPYFLLAISRDSVESREVMAEWRGALSYSHRMLLAIIDDVPFEAIPTRLRIIQWVNLHTDEDAALAKLIAAIKGRDVETADDGTHFTRWPITGSIDRMLTAVPLSGRDSELAQVKTWLKTDPVSILGVGGLGKSRLAAEVALTQEDIFGVIWHRASPTSRAEQVLELVNEHFGLDPTTKPSATLEKLRTHKRLIVLDNAEDVPPDDARYADYIALVDDLRRANAQVLITSRLEWEDVQPGKMLKPHELTHDAAAKIVTDMGEALQVENLAPRADEVAEAARRHPRLIEWAVGQMRRFEFDKILADLRSLKSARVQDALDEMIRKTLRQMIESDPKGTKAEAALKRLLVCRGGFTYAAAEAICPDMDSDALDAALETLIKWRFVNFTPNIKRYTIPEMVYVAVNTDESAHRPHYDYYKALAWKHHNKQDYLGLDVESNNLEAAFEWAMGSGDVESALWLSNGCSFFLANRGRFGQRLAWIERAADALENHPDKLLWGNAQNSLGVMYREHPIGNRRDNLRRAVAAYEAALVYRTPEAAPQSYAMTQNNLGTAYRDLSEIEDRADNLRRAIAAYEAALIHYTPEAAPQSYAMTQNNLGIAYRNLSEIEDRAKNLRRAITAYEAALIYHTPEAAPLDYAMTQNNLGNAYSDLAQIADRAENLRRAVAAYETALVYRTPEAAPLDYAGTQNNLGAAYSDLAQIEDRAANLRRAVAAYEAALVYRTPEAAPLDYAMTQRNLGILHEDLGDLAAAISCWREAEKYYRLMGAIDRADLMLKWIEDAEQRLSAGDGEDGG